MNSIVCSSKKARPETVALAKEYARQLGLNYLDSFPAETQVYDYLLVVENQGLKLLGQGQSFFFHPSMSKLRIEAIRQGKSDNMAEAMQLQAGMSVLDTTLGLGSDSIVCSYIVGSSGRVVGLEASKLLAFVVGTGLANYQEKDTAIAEACRRIEVHNTYALDYLSGLPSAAFDIVYIDPMFTKGVDGSSNMLPLRAFAVMDNLSVETLQQAQRVAAKRVVIKQPYYSSLLKELNFTRLCGGRYSRIKYAVIEV
mgnify:CR=1 FL=1